MREILFRGKNRSDGQWVQGDLNQWLDAVYIAAYNEDGYTKTNWIVDAETVGQFTGVTDINEKKIFEGDIVQGHRCIGWKSVVEYCTEDVASCGCCVPSFSGAGFKADGVDLQFCAVIGNIHDNPELLEGGADNGY